MSPADPAQAAIDGVRRELFIGGRWRPATGGRTFAVEDPATGDVLCEVADASPEDARAALDAAAAAQAAWADVAPGERSEILRRAVRLVEERTDELAMLITLEMGKSLEASRQEVAYGNDYLRWFAEEGLRIDGGWKVNAAGDGRVVTMHQPVGPCLLITPWNVPFALAARKIAPALVIPTSTSGPTPRPLFDDPRLRKVSLTGSTEVGRVLLAQAAPNVLRTSMELGGNAPFVVCSDADVGAAVRGAVTAKMRNLGEACIAANPFLDHADVADELTERLAGELGSMAVGPGLDPEAQVGPLIDARSRERVAGLVDDAVAAGARVVVGGEVPAGPGHFYPPTVLADVPPTARVMHEEIFGPVAPIAVLGSDEELLAAANDTALGLVGYVFTQDIGRAVWFAERLESGMVGVNRGYVSDAGAPFGGIKQSGLGREGGSTGIDEYLELKYLALDVPPR